ncbi:MAG TPA: hypothetical protein VHX90_04440 [Verrucomicrobiae bacterium]|nr:hypothetical protein [Verrucomicrobiae bacterium]
MNTDETPKKFAWEPLTPRGVAAFAHAKFSRLLLVQFVTALLAAISVVWFLDDGCFPTIRAAIQNLPDAGKISSGKLDWRGNSPQLLAEGKFLAFDVDLNHSGQINSTADLQIEFGKESVRIFSLLGYAEFFYPPDRFAPFNRTELEPLWGAWSAEILFIAAAATVIGLLLSWWILATIYFLPVWILGFFTNRDLNFRACWKFSGAALMPGALLMAAGIFLYGFGALDLVKLGFIFSAHFVLGWIYLFVSLLFLPRISEAKPKANPFKPSN